MPRKSSRSPDPKLAMTVIERDRGRVPSRFNADEDTEYGGYLTGLRIPENTYLRQALASCPDTRFRLFLSRLMQPRRRYVTPQAIAKNAGIGLQEFKQWVQKTEHAHTLALATTLSPRVIGWMGETAENVYRACERCDGLGWVNADEGLPMDTPGYRILRFIQMKSKNAEGTEEVQEVPVYIRTCPNGCDHGKILTPGSEFSQEKILETAGHINKKGPGLQITQNFGGAGMASAIPLLQNAMTVDIESDGGRDV